MLCSIELSTMSALFLLLIGFQFTFCKGCFHINIHRQQKTSFQSYVEECDPLMQNITSLDKWWDCIVKYKQDKKGVVESNTSRLQMVTAEADNGTFNDVEIEGLSVKTTFSTQLLSSLGSNILQLTVLVTQNLSLFHQVPQGTKAIISPHIREFKGTTLPYSYQIQYNDKQINAENQNQYIDVSYKMYDKISETWWNNGTRQVCKTLVETNTLSPFAVIVMKTPKMTSKQLGLFSAIGCSVSSFGLALTIIIYLGISELRSRQPTIFLVNICFCLLAANLTFLFGIDRTRDVTACYVIAALLHFFLLASWCWMSANAYNMYYLIMTVFQNPSVLMRRLTTALCYLVPLAITATTLGVGYFHLGTSKTCLDETSNYRSPDYCWITNDSLKFGFLVPVSLIYVATFYWFATVLRHITCHKEQVASTQQKRSATQNFMIAFSLIMMTGMTWIFGFLSLISHDITYQTILSWLFTIANCSQGIVIFVLNCLRKKSIRQLWLHTKHFTSQPIRRYHVDTSTMERNIRQRRGMSLATGTMRSTTTTM